MKNINIFSILLITALVCSCDSNENRLNFEVDEKGEPPKRLKEFYFQEFKIEEKNYVIALGRIHTFLVENSFYPKYSNCFDATLDIMVIANKEKYNKTYPCIVLQAEKGAPTKSYLVVNINEVKFNQLDGDNRLQLMVKIYGLEKIAQQFKLDLEPTLNNLYGTLQQTKP